MESTLDNPFSFFDIYLGRIIYDDWNKFRDEIIEHIFHSTFDVIDEKNKFLKVFNSETSDFVIYPFEKQIRRRLEDEIQITKQFLQQGFQQRFSNKVEVNSFGQFNKQIILRLKALKAFKEFSFLDSIFKDIENLIESFSKGMTAQRPLYSFNLLDKNNIGQAQLIHKLYGLLVESPTLINSSLTEFNLAFSGGIVKNGINWMSIGKNKQTNKKSLIYFLDELINYGFISRTVSLDKNKFTLYCFRNSNGNTLKNLKQSRSSNSNKIIDQDRIDSIISSL